jgi:hypothetical protein
MYFGAHTVGHSSANTAVLVGAIAGHSLEQLADARRCVVVAFQEGRGAESVVCDRSALAHASIEPFTTDWHARWGSESVCLLCRVLSALGPGVSAISAVQTSDLSTAGSVALTRRCSGWRSRRRDARGERRRRVATGMTVGAWFSRGLGEGFGVRIGGTAEDAWTRRAR